jgi:hypothetical protein
VTAATVEDIAARLASRPAVERVARAGMAPMWGISFQTLFVDVDTGAFSGDVTPSYSVVTSNYFATVGMRLLRGSLFDDRAGAPRAIVVNEAMAKYVWRGRDAIGRCVRFGSRENPCYTVVGIVETARRDAVIEDPKPQYYVPAGNAPERGWPPNVLIVRARQGSAAAVAAEVMAALSRAFPAGAPTVQTMTAQLDRQYRPWRLGASLFSAFGALALVVALVGIYSTVSYTVGQRTREFGIRIALGARVADVLKLVVGDGVRVVAAGVVLGVVLALVGGRLVAAVLYGVKPSDPAAMLLAGGTLLVVSVIAALVPAVRAARVDPNVALRAD